MSGESCCASHHNISWWLQVTRRLCSATELRTEVQKSLETFHPRYKRLQEPDSYTVTRLHTDKPPSGFPTKTLTQN